MNNEIEQALNNLIDLIKNTNAYENYSSLMEEVYNNKELNSLLYSYKLAAKPLQLAAVNNTETDEESLKNFRQISNIAFNNETLGNFINYDMQIKKLLGEIIETLSEKLKIEY